MMIRSIRCSRRQTGAALITSLLMLLVLTIIAITTVQTTSVDSRIAYNTQVQQEAEAVGQRVIADIISDIKNFYNPAAKDITVGNLKAAVKIPVCVGEGPIRDPVTKREVYSARFPQAPRENNWELEVTVNENEANKATGLNVVMTQGVAISQLAGYCL